MGLECLVLTRDSALLSGIRAKFNELGIEILVRKDAALAVELSKRRHLDGFVIDCDEVPGGEGGTPQHPGKPREQAVRNDRHRKRWNLGQRGYRKGGKLRAEQASSRWPTVRVPRHGRTEDGTRIQALLPP